MSLDGRVQAVNPALTQLLGEPSSVLVGRRLSSLVHPDDLAELAGPGDPGSAPGVARAAVRLLCSGGRLRWCQVDSALVKDARGRPGHVVVCVVDITRHKQSQAALRDLATRDPLSGLANRRWFELQLARHLRLCSDDGPRGALLLLDLDNFKAVNDTLGHQAGDRLVMGTAATLRRHLRDGDVVARLGGDEFAVVLRHGSPEDAETVARKLVAAVREEVCAGGPASGPQASPPVTVSVGVAPFAYYPGEGAGQVLEAADSALYSVKRAGRNGYALAGRAQRRPLQQTRAAGPALDLSASPAVPGASSRPAFEQESGQSGGYAHRVLAAHH